MEFVEAMKKFSKICKGDGKNQNLRCVKECPFAHSNFCTRPPFEYDEEDIVEAEKIISEWKREYEEPKINLPKDLPIDAKIEVSQDGIVWSKRHFAGFTGNHVETWTAGKTSWTTREIHNWSYARLPKEDENDNNGIN